MTFCFSQSLAHTWQSCDEVSLEHGHEDGVDVLVLVERHACNQLLHKLRLPTLHPALKVAQTEITLVVKVLPRRHGELAGILISVLAHRHLGSYLMLEMLPSRPQRQVPQL